MPTDHLAKLRDLFQSLATDQVFPNLTYRNNNPSYFGGNPNLIYFEADRLGAADSIERVLADDGTIDDQDTCYVKAAQEVAQALRSFDQVSYAKQPDFLKAEKLQEMVHFYTERFDLILDGTDFAGKPMDVKEYVSELSQRKHHLHDGVGVPNSLNVIK